MMIFDLFDKARQSLKWPKITYLHENQKLTFVPSSKYPDTRINIYMERIWIGRIIKDNEQRKLHCSWNDKEQITDDLKNIIRAVAAEPIGMCSLIGQQFAHCCFCGLELTNKNSVTIGYGPICAEKWGLPWEGAYDEKQAELL